MRGKQRYRCRACGPDFTATPPRGKPFAPKLVAVPLHVGGLPMNRTAKPLGVATPGVMARLEPFAKAHAQKARARGPGGGDRATLGRRLHRAVRRLRRQR